VLGSVCCGFFDRYFFSSFFLSPRRKRRTLRRIIVLVPAIQPFATKVTLRVVLTPAWIMEKTCLGILKKHKRQQKILITPFKTQATDCFWQDLQVYHCNQTFCCSALESFKGNFANVATRASKTSIPNCSSTPQKDQVQTGEHQINLEQRREEEKKRRGREEGRKEEEAMEKT